MFLIKRDFFYLILAVVSLITLLTLYIPHKKICVKQGAPLFILPTKTSTMSTKIDNEFHTMLLGEHGDYKKVEYQEGVIGWDQEMKIFATIRFYWGATVISPEYGCFNDTCPHDI